MKDIFEKILEFVIGLAIIFVFTWIIFGVYFKLPFYNVCYWYMLVLIGILIWGWLKG